MSHSPIIRVVDSITGSGKSSAAINQMNADTENSYIYITPYLSEIERIKQSCPDRKFYEPKVFEKDGETFYKLDSLHTLLSHNKNIATTHALFKMATEETKELIYNGNYILVLDEVMEVVKELHVSSHDVKMLFNEEWVYEEDGLVLWNILKEGKEGEYKGEFKTVRNYALNRNLVLHKDKILIWEFPASIFKQFQQVYVLTYLFNATMQKYFFDIHKLKYQKYYAINDNGIYSFKENTGDYSDKHIKEELKQKIHIYNGELNRIGDTDYSLSKTWYKEKKQLHTKLKNNVLNYFMNILKSKSDYNMWTTFKDYRPKIKGKGYSKAFLSCTARATNEYKHKNVLAYTVNRFLHPTIESYFSSKGSAINEDLWALSELIQWVFRSAIRDDKEINIYIPSKRMRDLFIRWLDDNI